MDTISLTYQELAARLGITVKSAKNHVARRKWMTSLGNDGRARISVPVEELPEAAPEGASEAPSEDTSHPVHALQIRVAALESELAGTRQVVDVERRRGDEAVERLARVEEERRVLQSDRDDWMRKALRPWWRRLASG